VNHDESHVVHIKQASQIISHAPPQLKKARGHALDIIEQVLTQLNPSLLVSSRLTRKKNTLMVLDKKYDLTKFSHIYLIGFGKASYGMAQGVHAIVDVTQGAIITTEQKTLSGIDTYQGTHPLPSQKNIQATQHLLDIVNTTSEQDLLLVLISGGGSSLFCHPTIPLDDLTDLTATLLNKGCTITELNTIRGHLSTVKLGKLAMRTKAHIVSLIISDVIGDPLDFIASGPTYPGTSTPTDAKKILQKYSLWDTNPAIKKSITRAITHQKKEKKVSLKNVDNLIIANNQLACTKAATVAQKHGYYPYILTTTLQGEARQIGKDLARYAKIFPRANSIIIAGGETTVTVTGNGKGGRNQELVLSALQELHDIPIVIASCGTDGIDGFTNAAGAIADGYSLSRASKKGLDPCIYLKNNDSYTFFHKLSDLLITGPTGTNVMDLHVLVIP